ncbi:hypothetical protein HIM_01622 [Hirsutella minnesotensis 3608]|nr:hypothetical protein HIM_01622 [Hirsutella minnesotensis 3608]
MDRDRDGRGRRYDDGEIIRYGAGESWRPTPRGGDRSPRRARSPMRERPRSPRPRSPRPRSPVISGSDSYVPGRYQPRRRSRSGGDHYRRERSRERDSPRRRERTRSPMRRRSPSRRASPARDSRFERPRSPRRDWNGDRDQGRDRDRDRVRPRDREFDRRDDRRRSRSPFTRDRRDRSPIGRMTPMHTGGGSYRPRSRSPSRRDRYQSYRRSPPPRESGISSTMTSRPTSERASPRPNSNRPRSPQQSQDEPDHAGAIGGSKSNKDVARPGQNDAASTPVKSPPRGPAALRAPPTGPSSNRSLSVSVPSPVASAPRHPPTPGTAPPHRSEVTSPTNPPSGPRGYVPPSRGSFASRPARGGWSQPPSRQMSGPSPSSTPGGPSPIPTGPRSASTSTPYPPSSSQSRPFNPPTGPSTPHSSNQRQTLAQSLLATMPPIVPGGKLDPSMTALATGVTRELEPHYRKLRDEEEKLREDLRAKEEKLRKSLYVLDKLGRDSRAWELRSDLSEKSMKNLAGEGMGGAAF